MSKTIYSFFGIFMLVLLVGTAYAARSQVDKNKVEQERNRPKDLPNLVEKNGQSAPLPIEKGKFFFSVTLHKREEINSLLTRAEDLSKTMRRKGNNSVIALILHGPEIRLFTKENYKANRDIVEKAARLDKENVIQVKVCKTKMKELGIKDEDLPSFMEIIPYAPDEEKKLLDQGYVYL